MVSGSGIDRDRLTGGPRVSLAGILLGFGALAIVAASVWYFAFRGSEEPIVGAVTTTSTPAQATTAATAGGETTTTAGTATVTTLASTGGESVAIPILSEEEAFSGEQARLVWLPGSQSGWIVDMEAATAGRFVDLPGGPRGGGAPARDGSLLVEIGGRVLRRTPDAAWIDISPSADRSYRFVASRTGHDHFHVYLIESGGGSDRLVNLHYNYEAPEALEEQWVAEGEDVVRVSASTDLQLVIVELAPESPEEPPRYRLLAERTGRETQRSAFPASDPGVSYVWGVEFAGGSQIFYMRCEAASYAECSLSDGFIVDLSSGVTSGVGDLHPGWSREWETPIGIPSFTHSFGNGALLIRTNVDHSDLQTGERTRLISARDY